MKYGTLTLIPTPIAESLPLEATALEILRQHAQDPNSLLLVEEHKVARRHWLEWGLPREAIERFTLYNEHNQKELLTTIITKIKNGSNAILFSDGGLPAFCDPGEALVNLCHENKIKVTASPFPNSIALAIALSGFPHRQFFFAGFLPASGDERKIELERISKLPVGSIVLMDTPYRLQALLKDLALSSMKNRKILLATELNSPNEKLFRGTLPQVMKEIGELNKLEFILVIAP